MINLTPKEELQEEQGATMAPKYSDLPLDKWLVGQAKRIADLREQEGERTEKQRVHMIVQMRRRFRGRNKDDLFGFFKNGYWNYHDSMEYLNGINIFQALLRGAEASFTQAKIRLDIKSSSNNYENRSAQKIVKGIYNKLTETAWTEAAESQMFYGATLTLNYYIISRFNRGNDDYVIRVPKFSENTMTTEGMAICNNEECNAQMPFSGIDTVCPECGSDEFTVINEPQSEDMDLVSDFEEFPAGSVETIIADGLEVSVDDTQGKPNDITGPRWAEYRQPTQKDELKKLYPHLKLETNPEWSYATRWRIALQRHESAPATPTSKADREIYELREIWLDKCDTEEYISPSNYKNGNFEIKQGERLSEVAPNGVCFAVVGDEVAYVCDENKSDVIAVGSWLVDPSSHYGLGVSAGLEIQRTINQLHNMNLDGINRALRGSIIYDPEYIDGAHLEGSNSNIPLRAGAARHGAAIDSFFKEISTTGLQADVVGYLLQQKEDLQRIMGVPDATIGEGDPNNKTATGQQILANRAVGLLIPAKKSQAFAMESWLLQQCKLIQTYYSPDRIKQEFGTSVGEMWLDEELEAFKEADLKSALTISYVEGSEVPVTKQEKEAKLLGIMSMGIIPPTPQLMAKVMETAGLEEFDIGDFDSNTQLAMKRWSLLTEEAEATPEVEAMFEMAEAQMIDPMTGARMADEMGNPLPNPIVMQIVMQPEFAPDPDAEAHDLHMEFWNDKVRGLAVTSGSKLLRAVAQAMVTAHQMAVMRVQTRDTMLGAMTEAPTRIAEAKITADVENEIEAERAPEPVGVGVG